MAITIQDYVESKVGVKDHYSGEDYDDCRVHMVSGCQHCHASLAPWNSYPTTTGYIACGDCVGNQGFKTVDEWLEFEDNIR